MNEKKQQRLADAASPYLQPGEVIEASSVANVGTVSVKRKLATAAIAGVLSGGTLIVSTRPRSFYIALTNSRMLLFAVAPSGRPEKKLAISLPRTRISATAATRKFLTYRFELTIQGDEKGLRFVFPYPNRVEATTIAAALDAHPATPVA
jgi:hypothetical protein